jgi:predicted Fe-S protein YdhL (DUF1289 family)
MTADDRVNSPCVSICVLDEKDVCQGCFRTAVEITDWLALDNDTRRKILDLCEQRRQQSGWVL